MNGVELKVLDVDLQDVVARINIPVGKKTVFGD